MQRVHAEDFTKVRQLYDEMLSQNGIEHSIIYPRAYGASEYIGQYSDNTVSDLKRMAREMALPAGARVLDGGCGAGVIACLFAEEFEWSVTGVDISQRHLELARKRGEQSPARKRLVFINQNLYDVSEEMGFDGIYGTGAWCHFNAVELFRKLARLVRVGGRVAFMERVRRGLVPEEKYDSATRSWACPAIYTAEEYISIMKVAGLRNVVALDMSEHFGWLQAAQIQARFDCKDDLIRSTSHLQFDNSLALARAEYDLTAEGLMGYILIVAERV